MLISALQGSVQPAVTWRHFPRLHWPSLPTSAKVWQAQGHACDIPWQQWATCSAYTPTGIVGSIRFGLGEYDTSHHSLLLFCQDCDIWWNEYGQMIAVILLGFNKVFGSLKKRSGNSIIVFKYARDYYEEGSSQLFSIATKGRTKKNELSV